MRKQEMLQSVAKNDKIQNPQGDSVHSCKNSYAKWHKTTKSSSRYEKAGNMTKSYSRYEKAGNSIVSSKK